MFSIIIPVYNRETTIIDLVNKLSILPHIDEIVIIDDHSKHDIKKLFVTTFCMNLDSKVKIHRNKSNSGPAYSRNIGLKIATSDYVIFLDSDDEIFQERLTCHYQAILADNSLEYVYSTLYEYSTASKTEKKTFDLFNLENLCLFLNKSRLVSLPCTSSFTFKKSSLLKKRIFFPNLFRSSEDTIFKSRILLNSLYGKVIPCESVAVKINSTGDGITQNWSTSIRNRLFKIASGFVIFKEFFPSSVSLQAIKYSSHGLFMLIRITYSKLLSL